MPAGDVIPVAMLAFVVGSKMVSHLLDAALTKMLGLILSVNDLFCSGEQALIVPVRTSTGLPSCATDITELEAAVTAS